MEVPLMSLEGSDDVQSGASQQRPAGRCGAVRSWLAKTGQMAMKELRSNAVKAILTLATIVLSTYTAYQLNNLSMQLEISSILR